MFSFKEKVEIIFDRVFAIAIVLFFFCALAGAILFIPYILMAMLLATH